MPALPALLLSLHFLSFLLVTMPPRSLSQAPLLSSVRMGKWPADLHPQLRLDRTSFSFLLVHRSYKCRLIQINPNSFFCLCLAAVSHSAFCMLHHSS